MPLADGWLGGRQLQRLEEVLDGTKQHFRMLLIIIRCRSTLICCEPCVIAVGFTSCCVAWAVSWSLHGHEHRDLRATLDGPSGLTIPVIGVGRNVQPART